MLLKQITFDEKAYYWTKNRETNIEFLRITERYLNESIRQGGYIYLNRIYENLGVAWNPDDENPCIRNDGVDRIYFIQFEIFDKPNNSLEILIHRYD